MTIINCEAGDSSSKHKEKFPVNNANQNENDIMHIIEKDNIKFDDLIQKELNQLKNTNNDIKQIEEKYFLSTDDFKEKLLKPTRIIKPRHKLTTLYEKVNFYNQNSSLDTFTSLDFEKKQLSNNSLEKNVSPIKEVNMDVPIKKDNYLKNDDIRAALEKLEKIAMQMPNIKLYNNGLKEKLKYKVKLYNFMLPENPPEDVKVKCPPFIMLLEHTIGVLLLIFLSKEKANNLQHTHLKWAIFFLKSLSKKKKQKEISACIKKLKEYLLETETKTQDNDVEYKISVETIKYEAIQQDSLIVKRLHKLLRKESISKENRETLNTITKLVTKLKLCTESSKRNKYSGEPYSYISRKIDKMEELFNSILGDIKEEKFKLMSTLRTNHGSLAISLCKIEKELNNILDMRKNYKETHDKLNEAIKKLMTMQGFLSLFEKRNSLESKFNDSVDTSLRKIKMIRRSLDNISETIYSNIIS